MPKLPSRLTLVSAGFTVVALAITGRAAQLQLVEGSTWRQRAAAQHTVRVSLPARRGTLYDRHGVAIAVSQETFAIGVAPRDLHDLRRTAQLLARATGRPLAEVRGALESARAWVEWPGPYSWEQVEPLRELRGVHLQRRLARFYPRPDLAPRIVGRVGSDGRGLSGLERAFDSLLAGRAGYAVMLRDHRGQTYQAPSLPGESPVDGDDVWLTLDAELQEIADRALRAAVAEAGASGGDVVIMEPAGGEILAIASVRQGVAAAGLVSDVFEPGSTAKVFTAAALLRSGRATPFDTVDVEGGTWRLGTRTIHDTHPARLLTLADVIRYSSNVGIAKLGSRLSAVEQYEALRDFGFGTPTGVELPGESPGRLRPVRRWTAESPASLAMGYELAVTPLQLAAAYSVFATGGVLMEPSLLREVRDSRGNLRYAHRPRPVRRVVAPEVAAQLARMLRGVVEEGTGRGAALGNYSVAGKTGTARRVVDGRYEEGRYTASFVGLFPAVEPQLVLVVKIDDPRGDYFGGATAAPVTRSILEAALATPAVYLDRSRLVSRRWGGSGSGGGLEGLSVPRSASAGSRPRVVELPWAGDSVLPAAPRVVPDVAGLGIRAASRVLHQAGFRVRLEGRGRVEGTEPAAGSEVASGTIITVRAVRTESGERSGS
ncbi:MAG TPA: penicillin-binding protein [Gemmatimonadales bacterium]|nr:penicillin-binding protein [Gemmatimonadales bacterium]